MYRNIRADPNVRGQALSEEFWCWEPRNQTDLIFQCPDGFLKAHKLLLRGTCRIIDMAMQSIADKGEEEVTIVLPGVSVGIVQKFLEFFYTGYTALMDKNDVAEFQDFLYNLMIFTGPVSINDVYDDPPSHIIDARNYILENAQKGGGPADLDTLKLLSQLSPVRIAGGSKEPNQGGDNYSSGNQFKIKTEDMDSSNMPAIDDSDIPSIVSNFLDGHSVFSPAPPGSTPQEVNTVNPNPLKRPAPPPNPGENAPAKPKRKSPTKKPGSAPRRKATDVRPRYCNQCDKQFYFQEPLDIHIKNVHRDGFQGPELVLPNYPGAKLTIAEQVISMKIWSEEFPQPIVDPNDNTNLVCPICRRSTKTKQSYKNHHLNNKKHGRCRGYELPTKPPKIVKDGRNYCGHPDCIDPATGDVKPGAENWPDTMAIYRHYQEAHAKEADLTFKCELCDKAFLTQGMLSSHKAHHLKPQCKYCGIRLTPKALKIHELNHLGEKPYHCEFCDFRSASKASVKNHKLSRHTSEAERPKNHVCDVENCGKAFTTKDKLKSHKRSHSDFREFLCSICGTSVKNKEYLAKHLIIHGIKFECHHCGKVCTSQKSLDIHKRDKHGILKPVDMSAAHQHQMEQNHPVVHQQVQQQQQQQQQQVQQQQQQQQQLQQQVQLHQQQIPQQLPQQLQQLHQIIHPGLHPIPMQQPGPSRQRKIGTGILPLPESFLKQEYNH